MCLLHKAKLICSNVWLFNDDIRNLGRMFLQNGYPKCFFDLTLKKYAKPTQAQMAIRIFHTVTAFRILKSIT